MRSWAKTILPLLCTSLGVGACGDSSSPGLVVNPTVSVEQSQSEFSIHAFLHKDGRAVPINFAPVPETPIGSNWNQKLSKKIDSKVIAPLHPQFFTFVGGEAGEISLDDPILGALNSWTLIALAADSCGMGVGRLKNDLLSASCPAFPPWLEGQFYIYSPPENCEKVLAYEENMLCVASKLNEIADAVSNITWDIQSSCVGGNAAITFPPQADKDRFIVRDLAIHVLANLSLLDTIGGSLVIGDEPSTDPLIFGCSELYQHALNSNSSELDEDLKNQLFGFGSSLDDESYFRRLTPEDTWTITGSSIDKLVASRLNFQTYILRSSGNLLHDMIRKSVFSDLASAERNRSRAADPLEGNRRAWGLHLPGPWNNSSQPDYSPAYGTSEHAMRVLAGRWEIGFSIPLNSPSNDPDPWGDPKCGGIRNSNLLRLGYGPDLTARVKNLGLLPNGQTRALELMLSAGIVIPPSSYGSNTELTPNLRPAILQMLKEVYAWKRDIRSGNAPDLVAFAATGQDKDIEDALNKISDADLRYALNLLYDRYRLHISAEDFMAVSADAGLNFWPFDVGSDGYNQLAALSGAAFENLNVGDFPLDMTARAGGMLTASQCAGNFAPLPDAPTIQGTTWGVADASRLVLNTFQDSFSIAQQLGRRLVATREVAKTLDGPVNPQKYVQDADAGVAELRSWAGPGYIMMDHSFGASSSMNIYLVGFKPEELGVQTPQQIPSNLRLVFGNPWVAECSAGIRSTCPAELSAEVTPSESWIVDLNHETSLNASKYFGADNYAIKLQFPVPVVCESVDCFDATTLGYPFFLIAKEDPSDPSRKGRVIGALAPRSATATTGSFNVTNATMAPVSGMQRELLGDVLAFPQQANPNSGASACQSGPQDSYCLDGVSRELFVPLENELTSDSDQYENSWRHYLNLARAAAEEADRLGKELIDIGLQRDMRREQALEKLGDLCGTYAEAANLSVEDGEVSPPPQNSKIGACLDSKNVDVLVFYNQPNFPTITEEGKTQLAREVLGCDTPGAPGICAKTDLTADTLNLVKSVPAPSNVIDPYCQAVADSIQNMGSKINSQSLEQIAGLNPTWLSKASHQSMVSNLKMEIGPDAHWTVTMNGMSIMSTNKDSGLWPGCLVSGSTQACQNAGTQAVFFSQVYRENAVVSGESPICTGIVYDFGNKKHCVKFFQDTPSDRFDIAWRIQASMWLMAGRAGAVPDGMFTILFPAATAKRNTAPLSTPFGQDHIAIPNIFGNAEYSKIFVGGDNNWMLDAATNSNSESFSLVKPPESSLLEVSGSSIWLGPSSVSTEAPSWLRNLGSDPSFAERYLLVQAKNNFIPLSSSFDPKPGVYGPLLNGLSCSSFSSSVTGTKKSGFDAWVAGFARWKWLRDGVPTDNLFFQVCPTMRVIFNNNSPLSPDSFRTQLADFFSNPINCGVDGLAWCSMFNMGNAVDLPSPLAPFPDFPENTLPAPPLSQYFAFDSDTFAQPQSPFHGVNLACATSQPGQSSVEMLSPDCLRDQLVGSFAFQGNRYALEPSVCSPSSRVPLFVNSYPPAGECGAISQYFQAMALSCAIGTGSFAGRITKVPQITSPEQIVSLESWLGTLAQQIQTQIAGMYVKNIPVRVVNDLKGNKVTEGDAGGKQRDIEQSLAKSLNGVPSSWIKISSILLDMKIALASARMEIAIEKNKYDEKSIELAIRRLGAIKSIVDDTTKTLASFINLEENPYSNMLLALGASISVGIDVSILENVDELKNAAQLGYDLQISAALLKLNSSILSHTENLKIAFIDLQNQVRDVATLSGQLQENQQQVAYELGKATGAPYVLGPDGKPLATYPVNQALNRQYDVTQLRYTRALANAKYLSYVARRAIEQRIGKCLNSFKESVGPLEPPAEWADDVCSLTGINYADLSVINLPSSGGAGGSSGTGGSSGEGGIGGAGGTNEPTLSSEDVEKKIVGEFADRYIGDYVRKLEQFVEYYNIEFPSHDGDDQVILSLRDDLIRKPGICLQDSNNLLFYSGNLKEKSTFLLPSGETEFKGWFPTTCYSDQPKCISMFDGTTVLLGEEDSDEEVKASFSGSTLLRDQSKETAPFDPPTLPIVLQQHPASVYQIVHLEPGTHVLSWQDQSRRMNGTIDAAGAEDAPALVPYRIGVYASDGTPAFSKAPDPFRPAPPPVGTTVSNAFYNKQWSARYEESFKIEKEGDYYLVFGASPDGSASLGSVLIRQVQLEKSPSGKATLYSDVKSERNVVSGPCPRASTEEFQKAFSYQCTDGACFYDLKEPLLISTSNAGELGSNLAGKLAADNFNYRHISVALNLVGTALIDCTKDPTFSCFGSGFLEYTLDHSAFQVPILGHDKTAEKFNFGQASINHGKALAAERYITIPLSSADSSLLSQPSIEKPEFRGRPLEGTYNLKIWDRPGLVWTHLDDVQIVLRYRYWSRITKQPGQK